MPADKTAGKQSFRAVGRFLTELPPKSWTAASRWRRMDMVRLIQLALNSTYNSLAGVTPN